jgi:hypothetical protein
MSSTNGWPRMTLRSSLRASLGLVLLAHAVQAQPVGGQEANASEVSRAGSNAVGPTSLELLEFIGEFTTEEGDWVDPALLETDRSPGIDDRSAERRRGSAEAGRADELSSAAAINCNARPCE